MKTDRSKTKAKPQQNNPTKEPPRPHLPETIVCLRRSAQVNLGAAVEAGAKPDEELHAPIPRHLIAAFQARPLRRPMLIRPSDYLRQVAAKEVAIGDAAIEGQVQAEFARRVLGALEALAERMIPLYQLAHDLIAAAPPRAAEARAAGVEAFGDIVEINSVRGKRERAARRVKRTAAVRS